MGKVNVHEAIDHSRRRLCGAAAFTFTACRTRHYRRSARRNHTATTGGDQGRDRTHHSHR